MNHDGHHQHEPNTPDNKHQLKIKMLPREDVAINQSIRFSFTTKDENDEPYPLLPVHTEKIHVIIVSEDFKTFLHEHPIENEDGYELEIELKEPGKYVLYADYTPVDHHQLVANFEFTVGKPINQPSIKDSLETNWSLGSYDATLNLPDDLSCNSYIELNAHLSYKDKPIEDLQDYLGSLAHIVIISSDMKEYLHVHPMESEETGPLIKFHTNFHELGLYHVFLQFKHRSKVQVARFRLKV